MVFGDDVLGLDDGGLEFLELALLRAGLRLDLRLERVDLVGELLDLGLLGGERGGQGLDLAVGFEDLVLELADGRLVVRDLVLDRLVLVVLLGLVELDREVVDLGWWPWRRCSRFLTWTLASWSALRAVSRAA